MKLFDKVIHGAKHSWSKAVYCTAMSTGRVEFHVYSRLSRQYQVATVLTIATTVMLQASRLAAAVVLENANSFNYLHTSCLVCCHLLLFALLSFIVKMHSPLPSSRLLKVVQRLE